MANNNIKGFLGCAAVASWLLLFAAGLLIDSKIYRNRIVAQPSVAVAAVAGQDNDVQAILPGSGHLDWRAFGVTMMVYTPLNAALLVMLSGFIGGCASSITYNGDERRNPFLVENPIASLLRSFLIYVGFIAGIYITGNAPFEAPTADQYVRFVGTLSLLAFVVGYDPTKFQELLNLVPRPGGGK